MSLFRVRVSYDFCIYAVDEADALESYEREHAIAISDRRCGVTDGPSVSLVRHESELSEGALGEVPINAFDYTARERLERDQH